MSDNTDPTRIVECRLVNAWGDDETYLFRNPTEAKEWINDYTDLCKAFDDISIKWHELPEGTIPEFTYAISQNKLVELAVWVKDARKFHTKWEAEKMPESLKMIAASAEQEANVKNPRNYYN